MKITFLGTRGYIDARTRRHYRHASTLITVGATRVMIDCGIDWEKKVWEINPDAILITHAHPDHAWGLKKGSPSPVYAAQESWNLIESYPIPDRFRYLITPRKLFKISTITIETFSVVHSIRAPAVGYRISAGGKTIFCVHDIVYIPEREEALRDIDLYIGDGASLIRPIIRRKDDQLFGHSSISTQLTWCQKEAVPAAYFTHCGSQIVESDGRTIRAQLNALGRKKQILAHLAYDGLTITL